MGIAVFMKTVKEAQGEVRGERRGEQEGGHDSQGSASEWRPGLLSVSAALSHASLGLLVPLTPCSCFCPMKRPQRSYSGRTGTELQG